MNYRQQGGSETRDRRERGGKPGVTGAPRKANGICTGGERTHGLQPFGRGGGSTVVRAPGSSTAHVRGERVKEKPQQTWGPWNRRPVGVIGKVMRRP